MRSLIKKLNSVQERRYSDVPEGTEEKRDVMREDVEREEEQFSVDAVLRGEGEREGEEEMEERNYSGGFDITRLTERYFSMFDSNPRMI